MSGHCIYGFAHSANPGMMAFTRTGRKIGRFAKKLE
jgi:hypothetical protein